MGGTEEFDKIFKKIAGNMGKNSKINMGAGTSLYSLLRIGILSRNDSESIEIYRIFDCTTSSTIPNFH